MFLKALLVGILSALFYGFFVFYNKLGIGLHYKKHHPGECRQVKGLDFGSEDFQVTEDGLAFITSGLDFPAFSAGFRDLMKKNNVHGQIYLFDFSKPHLSAVPLKVKPSNTFDPEAFHPHGISLLEDKVKGEHLLYVVNHPKGGDDQVEKFRFIPASKGLEHIRSFSSPNFKITNDLAVVGEDQFYISNCLTFKNSNILLWLESMLPLAMGNVLYVDKDGTKEAISGTNGANGVTLSKDKKFVYVAKTADSSIHVYERQADNSLKLVQEVPEVYSAVDNLHLSQDGDALLVGAHPILYKVAYHMDNPTKPAPSSVLRLPLHHGKVVREEITELFYDHGDLISGASVAHIYNNQLLIGSVINKLAICDLYQKPGSSNKGRS